MWIRSPNRLQKYNIWDLDCCFRRYHWTPAWHTWQLTSYFAVCSSKPIESVDTCDWRVRHLSFHSSTTAESGEDCWVTRPPTLLSFSSWQCVAILISTGLVWSASVVSSTSPAKKSQSRQLEKPQKVREVLGLNRQIACLASSLSRYFPCMID